MAATWNASPILVRIPAVALQRQERLEQTASPADNWAAARCALALSQFLVLQRTVDPC